MTIEDRHGVHLQGAARGIRGGGGTVLRSDRAIDLLGIFGNRLKAAGVTVSDLHLVGSGKENGKAGILVRGATDLLSLHNVGANHCGTGFHLRGGGGDRGPVVDAAQIQFCDPQVNGVGLRDNERGCRCARLARSRSGRTGRPTSEGNPVSRDAAAAGRMLAGLRAPPMTRFFASGSNRPPDPSERRTRVCGHRRH